MGPASVATRAEAWHWQRLLLPAGGSQAPRRALFEVAEALADVGQGDRLAVVALVLVHRDAATVGATVGPERGRLPAVRCCLLDIEAARRGVRPGQVDRSRQAAAGPVGLLEGRPVEALARE